MDWEVGSNKDGASGKTDLEHLDGTTERNGWERTLAQISIQSLRQS